MFDTQSYSSHNPQLPDSVLHSSGIHLPALRHIPGPAGGPAGVPDASMHRRASITYDTLPTPAMSLGCLERKKKGARRIWNHALEKFLFTPHEIATLGAPHRRTVYLASLEAHIDRLHSQMLGVGFYPVAFDTLLPYKGLNCKTAKGMAATLQFEIASLTAKLELTKKGKRVKHITTDLPISTASNSSSSPLDSDHDHSPPPPTPTSASVTPTDYAFPAGSLYPLTPQQHPVNLNVDDVSPLSSPTHSDSSATEAHFFNGGQTNGHHYQLQPDYTTSQSLQYPQSFAEDVNMRMGMHPSSQVRYEGVLPSPSYGSPAVPLPILGTRRFSYPEIGQGNNNMAQNSAYEHGMFQHPSVHTQGAGYSVVNH